MKHKGPYRRISATAVKFPTGLWRSKDLAPQLRIGRPVFTIERVREVERRVERALGQSA